MDLSDLTAALVADLSVGRFWELIERTRERMAELGAEEPESLQEWRRNPFNVIGAQTYGVAVAGPTYRAMVERYGRAEMEHRRRQVLTHMIQRAEGLIWSPSHEREGTTDDRRTESDGTQRRRAAGMGHGRAGDGGHGGGQVRGSVAGGACGFRHEWGDPQAGGVRPDSGAHRGDNADGRGIVNPWAGYAEVVRFDGDGCAPIITQDADDRAEALLREHLDERQANDWQGAGFFDVAAPSGNRYRVKRRINDVINLDNYTHYCLQAVGCVPKADTALAHKLWLEADEPGFLAAANKFQMAHEWDRRTDSDMERHLADAQREHFQRLEDIERSYREQREDEERRFCEEVEDIQRRHHEEQHGRRTHCEPQGLLRLQTLEGARLWAESQNWDVTVSIERDVCPIRAHEHRALFGAEPVPRYEVNDMLSDAYTVDLLRQVVIERNERHAAAFSAGVEWQRVAEDHGTERALEHFASLDCPMEIQVREGCGDAQP